MKSIKWIIILLVLAIICIVASYKLFEKFQTVDSTWEKDYNRI